jgi:hypothetical protein
MSDRTAWRICSANGWWSAFGRPLDRNGKKKRKRAGAAGNTEVGRRVRAIAGVVVASWMAGRRKDGAPVSRLD